MHICPSVDIIVYDITRGSTVLPGNKAYHQLKKNPHKASSPRGVASTCQFAPQDRASIRVFLSCVIIWLPQTQLFPKLTAENTAFSCPITELVSLYVLLVVEFFSPVFSKLKSLKMNLRIF